MPKIEGPLKMSGAFANMVFYKLYGNWYAKHRPTISQYVRDNSPRWKRVVENNFEFGYASQMGKEIRLNWKEMTIEAGNPLTSGKLSGEIYKIVRMGDGLRGERSTQFTKHGHHLEGFELTEGRNPDQHFSHIPTVQTEATENGIRITLEMPAKARHNAKKPLAKATHYSLSLGAMLLADKHYRRDKPKEQKATYPVAERSHGIALSEPIKVGKSPGANGTLILELPFHPAPEQALLITWGVKYYAPENGTLEKIKIGTTRSDLKQDESYIRILKVEIPPVRQGQKPEIPPVVQGHDLASPQKMIPKTRGFRHHALHQAEETPIITSKTPEKATKTQETHQITPPPKPKTQGHRAPSDEHPTQPVGTDCIRPASTGRHETQKTTTPINPVGPPTCRGQHRKMQHHANMSWPASNDATSRKHIVATIKYDIAPPYPGPASKDATTPPLPNSMATPQDQKPSSPKPQTGKRLSRHPLNCAEISPSAEFLRSLRHAPLKRKKLLEGVPPGVFFMGK